MQWWGRWTQLNTLFLLEITTFQYLLSCNFYLQFIYIYFITLRWPFDQLSSPCLLSVYTEIDRFIMVIFTYISAIKTGNAYIFLLLYTVYIKIFLVSSMVCFKPLEKILFGTIVINIINITPTRQYLAPDFRAAMLDVENKSLFSPLGT